MEILINAFIPVILVVLLVAEWRFPARRQPKVPFWRIKSFAFFVVGSLIIGNAPLLWGPVLRPYQLFDLTGLGLAGAAVHFGLMSLIGYAYHRARHHQHTRQQTPA